MAIRKIQVSDWECHDELEVSLGPGLNVVVGPSNVGKSALIRAIWAVLTGCVRPPGKTHGTGSVRVGAEGTTVTLETDRGTITISRPGGQRGTVTWKITTGRGTTEYSGLKGDVPPEVEEITGLKSISVSGQKVIPAVGMQAEGLFLMESIGTAQLTGTTAAKLIDSLAGVEEVGPLTDMLKYFARWAKSEIRSLEKQIEEQRKKAEEIDIDSARLKKRLAQATRSCARRIEEVQQRLGNLERILDAYRKAILAIDRWDTVAILSDVLEYAKIVDKKQSEVSSTTESLRDALSKREAVCKQIRQADKVLSIRPIVLAIERTSERLESLSGSLKSLKEAAARARTIVVPENMEQLQRASAIHDLGQAMLQHLYDVCLSISILENAARERDQLRKTIEEYARAADELKKELRKIRKKAGDICPTCGQKAPHVWRTIMTTQES